MHQMTSRRLTSWISLLATTAVSGAFAAPAAADPDAAAARRSCGTISSTSVYPYARVVAIRRVSCRTARRVAKRYDRSGAQSRGWRCSLAHGDRPRLFSCGSGAGRGDLRGFRRALEAIGIRRRSSAAAARCDTVAYGGRTFILSYRGLSCASARRKVRYVHRHRGLRGWRCSSGSGFRTGGFCRRGRRHFAWHPVD